MAHDLRVALAQVGPDSEAPEVVAKYAGTAEVMVFPETHMPGYVGFAEATEAGAEAWADAAIACDGPWVAAMQQAAREARLAVTAPFREAGQNGQVFNSALLINRDGDVVLHHRKVHIADFAAPESRFTAGTGFQAATIETDVGPARLGLLICMDREYATASAALSAAGVELALVPNCCDLGSDPVVGDARLALARGRAYEFCMGMAIANPPRPLADGHSAWIDAQGQLTKCLDSTAQVVVHKMDLQRIRTVRAEDPFRWRAEAQRPYQ